MKKPILVSGIHRSGTTWVGKVIESSGYINYITEPLNPQLRLNKIIFNSNKFNLWFPAIEHLNQSNYLKGYNDLFNYKWLSFTNISLSGLLYLIKMRISFSKKKTFLLKDPIALFSSEWIYKKFNSKNIILIRRPEAFVSSLKKNNWSFDFNNLLKQPEFIEKHLSNYKDDITKMANLKDPDIITQGILLWNISHSYILNLKNNNPNWYFVTHEELSLNPMDNFKKIFQYLDLDFNEKVQSFIKRSTSADNQTERNDKEIHQLNRNSKKNIFSWRNRLSEFEIKTIQNNTKIISSKFYNNQYL